VYSEAYYDGFCDPEIERYALQNTYDLYLLTGIDVPWVPDDLRDKPEEREEMFARFKSALELNKRSFIILRGSPEKRLEEAIYQIDKLLNP
jgi:nicotinamide riboside kinase